MLGGQYSLWILSQIQRVDQIWRERGSAWASYIKYCSHEVAKHKSGVICQFHLTVLVTFSHNIKEDGNAFRTNGERPCWITPYQKTSIYKSNVQVSKSPSIPVK
jgi:hypothetical protein